MSIPLDLFLTHAVCVCVCVCVCVSVRVCVRMYWLISMFTSCSSLLKQQTGDTCNGNGSNVVEGVYEAQSTDEDIYWSPSSKEEEIYAQMSRRKYQEIPRYKVKMLTKLGEGEFGEVYKAVLKTPTGTSQDVAVKVVKKGAPQEERLKLLQEAAILGQFRHRHVVSLFGVVTLGEPVSYKYVVCVCVHAHVCVVCFCVCVHGTWYAWYTYIHTYIHTCNVVHMYASRNPSDS